MVKRYQYHQQVTSILEKEILPKTNPIILISNSDTETRILGRIFSKYLKNKDVVCLNGELASGKTTFVQGIAEGLGIKEFIKSPSFTLVNNYIGKDGLRFSHIDLYRLKSNEIENLGIYEYIKQSDISVIEWADRAKKGCIPCMWDIKITWLDKNKRRFYIHNIRDKI